MTPTDCEGREYRPGQSIAYPYLEGCRARAIRRTVVSVEGGVVLLTPILGARIPEPMRRPERALIIAESTP
jgi:hypothetical protein